MCRNVQKHTDPVLLPLKEHYTGKNSFPAGQGMSWFSPESGMCQEKKNEGKQDKAAAEVELLLDREAIKYPQHRQLCERMSLRH